ncbi:hypothetical protein ACFL2A_05565 [Thermodesulfobacteriota bacterium]
MKKRELLIVNDQNQLGKEFYRSYDTEYWINKIMFLKKSHDNFDSIKSHLSSDSTIDEEKNFKRMLRTELHFFYFQMVEALFELIFAVATHAQLDLWLTLSFPNYRLHKNIYKTIKKFSKKEKIEPNLEEEKFHEKLGCNISLKRWVFYYHYPLDFTKEECEINMQNIDKLLRIFAKDFSDRAEYNAYKHSLRFYSSPFTLRMGLKGDKAMSVLSHSDDAITYLQERVEKDNNGKKLKAKRVEKRVKSFDFERDYRCCLVIYHLIKNIIDTRKYSHLEELLEKKFNIYYLVDFDILKFYPPSDNFTVTV